ncbi:MAG TPA: GAF domain-containing sensor histidine kinase [Ktedonobacteraceae bacterium]
MKMSREHTIMSVNPLLHDAASTRLSGRWLLLAKAAWMVLAGGAFVIFVISVPWRFIQLDHPPAVVQSNLVYLGLPVGFYAGYNLVLEVAFIGCSLALALVIFWHKSDEPMALFVALFLVTFGVTLPPTVYVLATYPAWQVAITTLNVLGWASLNLFGLLFPSGRFVPHWVRWLVPWFILYVLLWHLPGDLPFHPSHWPSLLLALVELSAAGIIAGAGVYRYRYASTQQQRQQIKWVVAFTSVGMLSFIAANVLLPELFPVFTQNGSVFDMFINPLLSCGVLLIPVSLTIAILRYRLWDIDLIINRTLIYGILTASVIGIYILVVGLLGTFLQVQGNIVISLLATGVVAVLFQPLRNALQRGINRLMFGERDDPYRVVSHLGQRLEATLAPEEVLPVMVETVARSLKLPYVAIRLKQDDDFKIVACYGLPREHLVRLPLIYQAETLGELVLAPRTARESFTSSERQLLNELARQAGIAVHAVLLTADLERSRQHIVAAREEARRRLGNDLHDGLGHTLAGVLRKVETASHLLERDPAAVKPLLSEIKQHTKSAIDDTRRLAHSLHPPELELLGLLQALRERVQQYHQPSAGGLHIHLESPPTLPPLPIAVEAATYYIALEALSNVVRHAKAQHCHLRLDLLAVDDTSKLLPGVWNAAVLELEICDDGRGLPQEIQEKGMGLGFTSMRERATELGGTCLIEQVATGGTRVHVRLPCLQATDDGR